MAKFAKKVTQSEAADIAAKASNGGAQNVYTDSAAALEGILSDAAASLPEPSKTILPETATAPAESEGFHAVPNSPATSPFASGVVIQDGFDPSIHEVDGTGSPVFNADGSYRRKRGRKSGVDYSLSNIGGQASLSDPTEAAEKAQRRAAAKTMVQLLVSGGVAMFGQEWQPVSDKASGVNERAMLEGAFENYFEAAGTIDIPPGIALALTVGMYAAPRFQAPQTQEKAAKMIGGIRGVFARWKDRRSERKEMKLAA